MIEVLEIDQWAVRETEGRLFEGFRREEVKGGDAGAIQRLGIAKGYYKMVGDKDTPPIGTCWMVNVNHKAMLWKANYDTSD